MLPSVEKREIYSHLKKKNSSKYVRVYCNLVLDVDFTKFLQKIGEINWREISNHFALYLTQ